MSSPESPRLHPQATTALVVGIVGLFFAGMILGPVAIYMGNRARGDILYSQGQLTGQGRATAAVVLGIIALVVWAAGAVAAIALFATV